MRTANRSISPRQPPTLAFVATGFLLVIGLLPLPPGASRLRQVASSPEPSRADREEGASSYYEGLINVAADASRNELALRLLGKPTGWLDFHQVDATRYLPGDLLQFELEPNLRKVVLGRPFSTNHLGMRDREYDEAKPPGVLRIALLGASMDMGWGVGDAETYENRLEDWLNAHARRRGLARRFEVMNWSMAAYSPLHRLETFRRKTVHFEPDLILFSATLLDPRLLEIHLCGLLQDRIDPGPYDLVPRTLATAGLVEGELSRNSEGGLVDRDAVKLKLRPHLWRGIDEIVGRLATECRSHGVPLAGIIIPRAGDSDMPAERGPDVARYRAILEGHDVPTLDLSATFDDEDPAAVEIAAWDDHPNTRGHKLLFQALAVGLLEDPSLRAILFESPASSVRSEP
jgi:hypothetical protein